MLMNAVILVFDEKYAPHASTTIQSILENGLGAISWKLYLVVSGLEKKTRSRLEHQLDDAGLTYDFVNASTWFMRLDEMGFPRYRGSHAANLKLFSPMFVDTEVDYVLYLDSDTIIMDSLDVLWEVDLRGAIIGMSQECLSRACRLSLPTLSEKSPYFNSGVMLFDARAYREKEMGDAILSRMKEIPHCSFAPDQDVLNLFFNDSVLDLGPRFNLQPFHFAYPDSVFFRFYGSDLYYSPERVAEARSNPVVLHTYRFLGAFPWMSDDTHPNRRLYSSIASRTPFALDSVESAPGGLFAFERLLYGLLPKRLFLGLWSSLQKRHYKKIGTMGYIG